MTNIYSKKLIGKNFFYLEICCLLIAGLLGGLVFSNSWFIPIIIIALNYLYLSVIEKNYSLSKIFIYGSIFGIGTFFSSLYWISNAFEIANYGGIVLGYFAVFLLSILLSFFIGSVCVVTKIIGNYWHLNRFGYVLVFATLLSIGEYLRGTIAGGFPWNTIGYVWAGSYFTLQGVSWIGIYGLGLLTYLAFLSPLMVLNRFKYTLFICSPLILMFIAGLLRLLFYGDIGNTEIALRIVQPSIDQKEKMNINMRKHHLQKLIDLSLEGINENDETIIIWPEAAIYLDLDTTNQKNLNLFSWIRKRQFLISGGTRRQYDNIEGKVKLTNIYNSIFILGSEEKIYYYYDKKKLVPFGEFIPFRRLLNLDNIVGSQLDFSVGKKDNTYHLPSPFPSVGLLVCYEIIFSGETINTSRPNVIINLTNDAWYGDTAGPRQHLSTARVRAIEEGLPVLRAANTGISAVIDPYGRYKYFLDFLEKGTIDGYVPKDINPTFFSIYGNLTFFVLCMLTLFLGRLFRN